jgi:hypothetical protein
MIVASALVVQQGVERDPSRLLPCVERVPEDSGDLALAGDASALPPLLPLGDPL